VNRAGKKPGSNKVGVLYLNIQPKNAAAKRFRRLPSEEKGSVVKQKTGAEENVLYPKQ
jgi:hypothetical protein